MKYHCEGGAFSGRGFQKRRVWKRGETPFCVFDVHKTGELGETEIIKSQKSAISEYS